MKKIQLTENLSLFLIKEELNFKQTIHSIEQLGFDALEGKENIIHLCLMQKIVPLPYDHRYIIGLANKDSLEKVLYTCGTILYYYPILYQITRGPDNGYHLGESCISGTGVLDNFQNNYIIGIKKPL